MRQDLTSIAYSLSALEHWIDSNGFAGFDPYDIKARPSIIRLIKSGNEHKMIAFLRELVFEFFYMAPLLFRRLSGIKPSVNAKAMGLFASAYLDLYLHDNDVTYLRKAEACLLWLKENKKNSHKGTGWGYPFDWQSKKLIPAGTPNGIVTTAVGDAFWKHYQCSGERESLDMCVRICEFLASLPVDNLSENQTCFSYTPLFINHVHNLNLFVAEFLIKIGMETSNDAWIAKGNRAVNYTLSDQRADGSFDYNGPPEKPNDHCDNYHTGFVLRMLYAIWKLTGRKDVFDSLNKCYRHYVHSFFENNTIPKLMPDRKYRIDIHSCAESIHCLSELSQLFPGGLGLAENILKWTMGHLQDKTGYFYYGIEKSRLTGLTFVSKIPYIRWGQAWMLKALASYLVAANSKKA
jgi:hypothetical protein